MVRTPAKICLHLSRLFEETEPVLFAAFLKRKAFERLTWLKRYNFDPKVSDGLTGAKKMLEQEKMDRLSPLETEAARIVEISSDRGDFVLEGLAKKKLASERAKELRTQRDELARSFWTYINEHSLFEAAENALNLQLYRRYDKHYQTFMAEPSPGGPLPGSAVLDTLLGELKKHLDRDDGYSIEKFYIPASSDEPAVEMYMLFHPDLPTSVREIDDNGNRSSIYLRPPGEAMIAYTPSTGLVHVRAGNRKLRHTIAERFIETALNQSYSKVPVDFQAYDISRFLKGFDLEIPEFNDVVIVRARVIHVEISVGNLVNRLSFSTTIDRDISAIINNLPGLSKIFEQAVAVRFVEIAVRYRRAGRDEEQTLDFTLSDRNTSSLLSVGDPFERALGHRLLRHWKILHDGRSPSDAESMAVIPAVLAIWDMGTDRVSGGWLLDRRIDRDLMTELGFLVPAGCEGDDLIDDEDRVGPVVAEVILRVGQSGSEQAGQKVADLKVSDGQEAPGGNPDRYRLYRVRDGWIAQHLQTRLGQVLDTLAIEELTDHLLYLGTLKVDGQVPVYLARGLNQEKVRSAVDTQLRARHHLGIGLVLQAGNAAGQCLAANVLTSLTDHIDTNQPEIALVADKLRSVFRRHRVLANGGQTVALFRSGDELATLFVPGKGSIDIPGENRIIVIQRLVDAHNAGPMPVATGDLTKGFGDQSMSNIFGQALWNKLKDTFVRSAGRGKWEIAT